MSRLTRCVDPQTRLTRLPLFLVPDRAAGALWAQEEVPRGSGLPSWLGSSMSELILQADKHKQWAAISAVHSVKASNKQWPRLPSLALPSTRDAMRTAQEHSGTEERFGRDP